MTRMLTGTAVAALLVFGIPTAYAEVAITCNGDTQAGNGALLGCSKGAAESGINNILFSDAKAITGVPTPVSTLVGITNNAQQTQKTAFSFQSATDQLFVTGGAGNATITSTDNVINNLSYFVTSNQAPFYGSTFNAFSVLDTNLQVNSTAHGQNPAGTVTFFIQAQDAQGQSELFNSINFVLGNGQNKFEFASSNGEIITKVGFNAINVNAIEVLEVKQNQVTLGNTPGVINPQCPQPPCNVNVPEPGALGLLGSGLLSMSGIIWYRRRKDTV